MAWEAWFVIGLLIVMVLNYWFPPSRSNIGAEVKLFLGLAYLAAGIACVVIF